MSEPSHPKKFLPQSYWDLKVAWEKRTPFQKWELITKLGKINGNMLHLRLFTDLSIGPLALIPSISSVLHSFLLIYTIYYYVRIHDFSNLLPSFCYFGVVVSTYTIFWISILKRHDIRKLIDVPGKIFYRNSRRLTEYNRICSECITHSLKIYVIVLVVMISSFIGAFIGPVYTYIHDGIRFTLYSLRLPYFNQYPDIEFTLCFTWEIVLSFNGVIGLFFIELFMAMFNNAFAISSKLTVMELTELSDQLKNEQITQEQCSQQLKKIFKRTHYMNDYVHRCSDIMYWRHFLAPPSFTLSIAVAIYCQFMMGYPAGYGIAVACYIQMANLCVTGQNVIDRNQRILDALYDFKWYLLANNDQKDMMCIINRFQNGFILTIGPFEILNYEVLKTLTGKIYSFLMFLINFGA